MKIPMLNPKVTRREYRSISEKELNTLLKRAKQKKYGLALHSFDVVEINSNLFDVVFEFVPKNC